MRVPVAGGTISHVPSNVHVALTARLRSWLGGFRAAYLPVLLTYFCYGASAVAAVAMLFFEKETLKLTAPTKTGNYEYVCTFPEHWKNMFGQLVVVKDKEALLQASAELAPQQRADAAHNH